MNTYQKHNAYSYAGSKILYNGGLLTKLANYCVKSCVKLESSELSDFEISCFNDCQETYMNLAKIYHGELQANTLPLVNDAYTRRE